MFEGGCICCLFCQSFEGGSACLATSFSAHVGDRALRCWRQSNVPPEANRINERPSLFAPCQLPPLLPQYLPEQVSTGTAASSPRTRSVTSAVAKK